MQTDASIRGNQQERRVLQLRNGLYAFVQSFDGYSSSHRRSLPLTVRKILTGIRNMVHPKPPLCNYFLRLAYDPASCDRVILRIAGRRTPTAPSSIFVNSVEVDTGRPLQHMNDVLFCCTAQPFEPWENIIALPRAWDVKSATLMPAFSRKDVAENAVCLDETADFLQIELSDGGDLLANARHDSWRYIFNARNAHPGSAFSGTYFAAYDLDRRTYCLNSWVWCSSAVVKALVEEYRRTGQEVWLETARSVTDAILRFQVSEGPNAGGIMVRWDVSGFVPGGVIRWLAPNDSAFIGAYAFAEMYAETGESHYLHAMEAMGEWIIREGMTPDGQLRVGYRLETDAWEDSWLYVDAGFCATLFEALFKFTGREEWHSALSRFMRRFVETFYSGKGYFYRIWRSSGSIDKSIFARGQGWALDGLLSAHAVLNGDEYLNLACAVGDFLIRRQNDNGSWNYLLDRPNSGECNKGTPIIGYHMLRLYNLTGEAAYRQSADEALSWCMDHMYRGGDRHAYGGISSANAEGCIAGVEGTNTVFTYSSAYFILAMNLLHTQVEQ